eukprot:m.6169 g.6169  ORF g.6169 m.6169 type:complete len:72 (+) comp4945_c0_seq1:62-277(+)
MMDESTREYSEKDTMKNNIVEDDKAPSPFDSAFENNLRSLLGMVGEKCLHSVCKYLDARDLSRLLRKCILL